MDRKIYAACSTLRLFVEVLFHDEGIFDRIRIIVLPLTQHLKSETFIKPDR